MSGAITAAVIIGAGASIYASNQQAKAQKSATNAQLADQAKAEEEANRIARETRPEEIGATLQVGGTTTIGSNVGSTADFLIPKIKSLGSSGGSGLGFSV